MVTAYESESVPVLCPSTPTPDVRPAEHGTAPDESGFLRGLLRGMRCGVVIIDADGRLVLINDLARRILEIPQAPPVGTPIRSALPEHPGLVQALDGSFAMKSLPNRAELELEAGTRKGKTIGFTLSMVRDENGTPCGAAMFFKDLTQIEHTEEQQRLKERLAALGQMAASMAHEIRNPLAAIQVACKLLGRRLGGDRACNDLLAKITAEVERLDRAVDSSLRFVRPIRMSFGRFQLLPLLEEAIAVAEQRRGKPGIVIERRFAPDIPPFLLDRERLGQVFVNLVLNAMEAVGENGIVTVEAERIDASPDVSIPYEPSGDALAGDPWSHVDHFVVVRVADTGPGISDEDRDRVFYPFFTTKKQGSGVGLALAKKIVGSHRGLIEVDSSPGKGAVFLVRLPMVTDTAEV